MLLFFHEQVDLFISNRSKILQAPQAYHGLFQVSRTFYHSLLILVGTQALIYKKYKKFRSKEALAIAYLTEDQLEKCEKANIYFKIWRHELINSSSKLLIEI
jgi:hypothetical protein